MSIKDVPRFGKPINVPAYYAACIAIVKALRPHSTLRTIAAKLNEQGYRSPCGLIWSKQLVANFIRSHNLNNIA